MSSRDDMVISPSLRETTAATPAGGRMPLREARAEKKSRLLRRVAAARVARRMGRRRASKVAGAGKVGFGSAARLAVGGGVTLAAAAAAVAIRLKTGRTFSGMGADLKKMAFGRQVEKGLARARATEDLMRNRGRLLAVEARGITDEERGLHKILTKYHLMGLRGAAHFREDPAFQVNSKLDLLALKIGEFGEWMIAFFKGK